MSTSPQESKAAAERAVFLHFAELCKESDSWLSVESRDPPEPDLLCMHAQRGHVAFELVAITDPLIAQVNAGHAKAGEFAFTTADPTERIIRKKLKRKYETTYPLELLIYNDLLVITPEDAIISTVLSWVGSLQHPFSRVWFMGEYSAACIWSVS